MEDFSGSGEELGSPSLCLNSMSKFILLIQQQHGGSLERYTQIMMEICDKDNVKQCETEDQNHRFPSRKKERREYC